MLRNQIEKKKTNAKWRNVLHLWQVTAKLVCSEKFIEYHNKFTENELDLNCSAYNILNKQRLRAELSVLYANSAAVCTFLKIISSNILCEAV